MNTPAHSVELALEPADNERLVELCGQFDAHLRQLEQRLGVEINSRGNRFRIIGEAATVQLARQILEGLYLETAQGSLTPEKVHLYLQEAGADRSGGDEVVAGEAVVIKTPGGAITPHWRFRSVA